MIKSIRFCLFLMFFWITVNLSGVLAQKLVKTKVTENITIHAPEDFILMTDEDLANKFISARKPLAGYTNYERSIEFSVNKSISRWDEKDLPLMKRFYRSSLSSLYDNVEMIDDGITEINKNNFAYFEFISEIKGEDDSIVTQGDIKKYTFIQYTIKNGETILFNFNCSFREKDHWQSIVKNIMRSVKIR